MITGSIPTPTPSQQESQPLTSNSQDSQRATAGAGGQSGTPNDNGGNWDPTIANFWQSLPSTNLLKDTYKSNKAFKIHIFIATAITMICALVWCFTVWGGGFPWLIYPIALFALSLSFHYYLFLRPTKEWMNLHLAAFIILNLMLFLTWVATYDSNVWFMFPLLGWGIFLGLHICLSKYHDSPHKLLYAHVTIFSSLNLMFFIIYMSTGGGYPWFLLALFSLAVLLIIHWNVHYHRGDKWRMHWTLFADIQLLLFLIWETAPMFPYFLFALIGWGVLLALHYWRMKPSSPNTFTIQSESNNGSGNNPINTTSTFGTTTGTFPPTVQETHDVNTPAQVQVVQPATSTVPLYPTTAQVQYVNSASPVSVMYIPAGNNNNLMYPQLYAPVDQ